MNSDAGMGGRGIGGGPLPTTEKGVDAVSDGGQLAIASGEESSWDTALSLHMRCRTEPMRRAKASIPRCRPRRFAPCDAQLFSLEARPRLAHLAG